jgi:adenylate kinase
VPDDITNPLFNDLIMKIDPSTCKYIILDGYPRNLNQAMFLEKTISIDKVILLSPTINTLIKRLSGRRICPKCKEIYNIYFAPPKINGICDVCNSTLFQRKDDNEIAAEKRIIEYNKETAPLIDYYNKKNKLKEFDSSVSVEELYKNVLQYLKE